MSGISHLSRRTEEQALTYGVVEIYERLKYCIIKSDKLSIKHLQILKFVGTVMSVHWDFPLNVNVKKKINPQSCLFLASSSKSCRTNGKASEIRAEKKRKSN